MTSLSVFSFEDQDVRFVGTAEKPEWVAVDVGIILDIQNIRQNLSEFDDDEKGVAMVETVGGKQEVLTVTEPGLYRLMFKSRKPIAKKFQRWIFHEVLPTIRQDSLLNAINKVKELLSDSTLLKAAELTLEKHYVEQLRTVFAKQKEDVSFPLARTQEIFDYIGMGIPDLVVDGFVFEVKRFCLWKHALGQIIAYTYDLKKTVSRDFYTPAVYLFDVPAESDIISIMGLFDEHDITVFYSLSKDPNIVRRA